MTLEDLCRRLIATGREDARVVIHRYGPDRIRIAVDVPNGTAVNFPNERVCVASAGADRVIGLSIEGRDWGYRDGWRDEQEPSNGYD